MIANWLNAVRASAASSSSLLADLVAYWNLDEATGNRADAGQNGLTLAESGTVPQQAGKVGNSAGAFSTSNYLSRANNADFSMTATGWTLVFWVYVNALTHHRFISKYGATAARQEWYTGISHVGSNDKLFLIVQQNDGVYLTQRSETYGIIPINTWVMCAARYTPATNKIGVSVNGGAWDETSTTAVPKLNTIEPLLVGLSGDTGVEFPANARIDEVGIWKRVLTDVEIAALYNGGGGNTYPF